MTAKKLTPLRLKDIETGRKEERAETERLREQVKELLEELAYHGVYPK